MPNLRIWDFYLTENLAHGSSYDFELIASDLKAEEEQEMIDGPLVPSGRKVLSGCYDSANLAEPAICSYLLQVGSGNSSTFGTFNCRSSVNGFVLNTLLQLVVYYNSLHI